MKPRAIEQAIEDAVWVAPVREGITHLDVQVDRLHYHIPPDGEPLPDMIPIIVRARYHGRLFRQYAYISSAVLGDPAALAVMLADSAKPPEAGQ